MGLNWLITGGCGFIGSSLISRLIKDGSHDICVIDNLSVGTREDLAQVCNYKEVSSDSCNDRQEHFVRLIVGDILDEQLAVKITKDIDVIVHLAANTGVQPSIQAPRDDCLTNVIGTLNYLEAARANKVKRFIFASSGAPVGETAPPIHEELPAHPVSPYGASKLAGEGYCSAYAKSFGLETIALRFGNVYGPGSIHKNSVIAKFIKLALDGKSIQIYGDGNQTRDFIYIEDLVDAICKSAATPDIAGEVFQIATNQETTVYEMVKILQQVLKKVGVGELKLEYAEPLVGDVKRNFSDTGKARKMLGWSSTYDLKAGMEKTVEFFRLNNQS